MIIIKLTIITVWVCLELKKPPKTTKNIKSEKPYPSKSLRWEVSDQYRDDKTPYELGN